MLQKSFSQECREMDDNLALKAHDILVLAQKTRKGSAENKRMLAAYSLISRAADEVKMAGAGL